MRKWTSASNSGSPFSSVPDSETLSSGNLRSITDEKRLVPSILLKLFDVVVGILWRRWPTAPKPPSKTPSEVPEVSNKENLRMMTSSIQVRASINHLLFGFKNQYTNCMILHNYLNRKWSSCAIQLQSLDIPNPL